MPPQETPRYPHARLLIGVAVLALIIAAAIIFSVSLSDRRNDVATPDLTQQDKLQLLHQLTASATSSATPTEKQQILDNLSAPSNTDETAKMQVMQNLQTN